MAWERLRELREKKAVAWTAMRGLLDTASGENRDLTGEEQETYDLAEIDLDSLSDQIERWDRAAVHEQAMRGTELTPPPGIRPPGDPDSDSPDEDEQRAAAQLEEFRAYLRGDARALTVSTNAEGGYLLAPTALAAAFIKPADDQRFIRMISHTEMLDAGCLPGRCYSFRRTSAMRTGRRRSQPSPSPPHSAPAGGISARLHLTKGVKISRALVRRTAGRAEDLVLERLGYKFDLTEEKAFLIGTGSAQPLGVFVASANGIPAAQDVTTATAAVIAADDLIDVKHSIKAQYMARGTWLFHRDAIKMIRKLKDSNGNYVWANGLGPGFGVQGNPDTILDRPFFMSENVPSTFTTGLYAGIFGDFEFYWIVDTLNA